MCIAHTYHNIYGTISIVEVSFQFIQIGIVHKYKNINGSISIIEVVFQLI